MLRQRLLTALIGIPLGLAVIYLGGWYLAAVVTVLAVLGMREFCRLAQVRDRSIAGLGFLGAAAMIVLAFPLGPKFYPYVGFGLILWVAIDQIALARERAGAEIVPPRFRQIAAVYVGWVYVPFLFGYLLLLRALEPNRTLSGIPAGAWWLFLVVGATWAMDIAAYGVGKAIGRHKLCPTISPGKTIEGAIGGLLGAVAVAWAMGTWLGLSATQAVLLGALLGIGGQAGDLFESLLKRRAGVKDSGTLLPGHGGVLDRFDSLLFNAPIAYYVIRVFVG